MEGVTMEPAALHDKPSQLSVPSPQASCSDKSPGQSEEDESKISCPSPLITERAGKNLFCYNLFFVCCQNRSHRQRVEKITHF